MKSASPKSHHPRYPLELVLKVSLLLRMRTLIGTKGIGS